MRKLISVFATPLLAVAILVFSASDAFAVPQPSGGPFEIKGARGSKQSDPVKVIKLVRFAGQSAPAQAQIAGLTSGDVVVYDLVSDDGVTIALTTTSGDGAIAGILVTGIESADASSTTAADDNGRRNWGFMIVHGPALAKTTAGGTNNHAAGEAFITSVDSGAVTTFQDNFGVDQASASRRSKGGFFMSAVTAADTFAKVFVTLE